MLLATAEKSPPSISVALVNTTVLSVSSLSRIWPHTCSGATHSRGGIRLACPSESHSTSESRSAAIRSAYEKTSCTEPFACVRPASESPSPSLGYAERQARAASRTSTSASARCCGTRSKRPGLESRDRAVQHLGGVGEVVGLVALDVALGAAGGPLDVGDAQLVGGGLGDPGGQLVGLVDDDDVVVGDHRHALDGVDGQQRVVGDDQVRAVRLLAGDLDEALGPEGALGGAEAVAVPHADLAPLPVGVPRGGVALAAAAVLGLLLGPRPQLEDLLAQRALGHLHEHALVVGRALAHPVQAGVVGAALEHGVRRVHAGVVLERRDQARQVALDQLVLERERRGGDHDPLVVEQARHQVGQRLAGAGAGLHQQVLAVDHRVGHGLRHLDLAGALLAAELAHRGGQRAGHRGRVGGGRGGVGGVVRRWVGHPRTLTAPGDTRRGGAGAGGRAQPTAYAASSSARSSFARPDTSVPSPVCSIEAISPCWWIRLTRSPRS